MRYTITIALAVSGLMLLGCNDTKKKDEGAKDPKAPAGKTVNKADPAPSTDEAPKVAKTKTPEPVATATTEKTGGPSAEPSGCGGKSSGCAGKGSGCGGDCAGKGSGCAEKAAAKGDDPPSSGEVAAKKTADPKTAAEKPGTTAPAVAAKGEPKKAAGKLSHFGGKFTLTDTVSLDDVIAGGAKYAGKNVRVKATISKVCKKKGCWMVLTGDKKDGQSVRVKFKDYGFFVPLDCSGKRTVVEGVLKRVEVAEAMRKHLAEDGGEDPKKVTGKAVELTMMATAVDIEG